MKKIKALYLGMAMAAGLASLTSCQADMDAPALVEPVATMKPNTTLSEFKTAFADQTVLCPMKDEASQTPYIIHGRVISSDATGNIYKSIVIQDETAALAISINQGSTYTDYRLGQEIVINATGLYIGYYNGLQQIGWYDEYNGAPSLTFLAWDMFLAHTEKNGFPNVDVQYVGQNDAWPAENPYCVVTSFSQLPATGEEFRNMQSQLVEFRNVYFEEGGKETYAPYQESVNRTLVDANGGTLTVRTSGYSNFYNEMMPEGTGTVRGILSYYGDAWQLLLRGLDDVMIFEKGQKDDPYTVAEAIEAQNEGYAGWVTAYIVGSVKAGVNNVTSNDDVIFGADAEMDNNILIAASPDVTDWSLCIAVELPQGSPFREKVNLVDNPGVYKKAILVSGTLSTYLDMPGLTGNGGTGDDVEVEGVTIGGGTDTPVNGDGSKEKPYSVAQVMASTADQAEAWVEGYVVGYVPAMTWGEAVFGNTPDASSTNWTNGTNIILSDQPVGTAAATNSIPVGLATAVRNDLAISKNPGIYGTKVKVKGELTKYFGTRGLKSVSEFEIIGAGGGDTPTPSEGSGTKESPYNVAQIMVSTADASGTWVEGYVVGYAPTAYWSDAVFGNTPTEGSTNYTNGTNLILSDQPAGSATAENSIPVGLATAVRDVLAISKNPAIYGAKVKVKGDLTKYFGVRGIKAVSEYEIIGAGGGDTPEPPATGSSIYTALNPSATALDASWKIQNVEIPSALSDIWTWKIYNNAGYLNASAYASASNTAYASTSYCYSGTVSLEGYKTVSMSFEHAAKFQTTCKQLCKVVVREAGTTIWTELNIPSWPAAGAWTFASSGDIDLSAFAGKKVEIGFKYASTAAGADTWEIKNLNVTAAK